MKKNRIFNNRSLTYEKPKRIDWTDDLIEKILELRKRGWTYNQIRSEFDLPFDSLKSVLCKIRKNPKWVGKIPYFVASQRPIELRRENDRIGILDIETHESFYANRGFMLCYTIKEHNKNLYFSNLINPKDIRQGHYDKFLCEKIVKDILKFDVIVGYYSGDRRFDLPFIRTRCAKNKVAFPFYNTIKQIDLYITIKNKYKLTRNTLKEACKMFGIKGKTNIDFDIWQEFVYSGNKRAGHEILVHNIWDCNITDKLYKAVMNYDSMSLKSI